MRGLRGLRRHPDDRGAVLIEIAHALFKRHGREQRLRGVACVQRRVIVIPAVLFGPVLGVEVVGDQARVGRTLDAGCQPDFLIDGDADVGGLAADVFHLDDFGHLGAREDVDFVLERDRLAAFLGDGPLLQGDLNIAGRDDVRRRILVREIRDGAVCGRGQADDEQRAGKQLLFHRSFPFLYVFFYSFYVRMPLFGRAYMDTPSASEYPYIPCLPAGKQSMEREK